MKNLLFITFITLFAACSSETESTSQDLESKADNDTETSADEAAAVSISQSRYVTVDNLNMRPQSGISPEVIFQLIEGDTVTLTGNQSEETFKATFRGKEFDSPWVEIETTFGITGWVHEGALSEVPVKTDPKLSADWYDTPEKRKEWWNSLSKDWKRVFNIQILGQEDNSAFPGDKGIQKIFATKSLEATPDAGCGDIYFEFQLSDCEGVKCLTNLTFLNLSGNEISDLTPLKSLVKLVGLDINRNPIKSLSGIANLRRLENLYIDGCKVKSLKGLIGVINLDYLSADYCDLINIEGTQNMKQLSSIEVRGNSIANFDGFEHLDNLQSLYIGDNPMKNLWTIEKLTKLTKFSSLGIDGCEEIPNLKAIKQLKRLERLDASYIRLESLEGIEHIKTFVKVYDYQPDSPYIPYEEIERIKEAGVDVVTREEVCGC